ncbi:MAG TPA: hypothetical protein EYP79_01895 [Campylobacterales bacterium]|nr:hypothetical protein [Campylobacterales bacterium]
MRLFFYAKTGHRVGLDRLRRVVALMNEFKEYEPFLMVEDFRAASFAKSELGVKKSIGIDDIRNMANFCNRGDVVIFDSDEYSNIMHQEMIDYFKYFIRVSDKIDDEPKKGELLISFYKQGENIINGVLVDRDFFGEFKKDTKRVFFYGDDDYEKNLMKKSKIFKDLDVDLVEGFYFFLNYQDELKYFKNIYEIEEYKDIIKRAKTFITSSPQTALEAAASKSDVIYIQREDKDKNLVPLLKEIGIKVLESFDKPMLEIALKTKSNLRNDLLSDKGVTNVARNIKNKLNL